MSRHLLINPQNYSHQERNCRSTILSVELKMNFRYYSAEMKRGEIADYSKRDRFLMALGCSQGGSWSERSPLNSQTKALKWHTIIWWENFGGDGIRNCKTQIKWDKARFGTQRTLVLSFAIFDLALRQQSGSRKCSIRGASSSFFWSEWRVSWERRRQRSVNPN